MFNDLLAFTETKYHSLYNIRMMTPVLSELNENVDHCFINCQSLNHIQITYTTLQTHFDIIRTVYKFQFVIVSKQTNLSALLRRRKTPFHCLNYFCCPLFGNHFNTKQQQHMLQSPVTVHKISVVHSGGRVVRCKAWLVYVQGLGFKYDVYLASVR